MSPQKNIIYIILQKGLKTDRPQAYEENMQKANANKNTLKIIIQYYVKNKQKIKKYIKKIKSKYKNKT